MNVSKSAVSKSIALSYPSTAQSTAQLYRYGQQFWWQLSQSQSHFRAQYRCKSTRTCYLHRFTSTRYFASRARKYRYSVPPQPSGGFAPHLTSLRSLTCIAFTSSPSSSNGLRTASRRCSTSSALCFVITILFFSSCSFSSAPVVCLPLSCEPPPQTPREQFPRRPSAKPPFVSSIARPPPAFPSRQWLVSSSSRYRLPFPILAPSSPSLGPRLCRRRFFLPPICGPAKHSSIRLLSSLSSVVKRHNTQVLPVLALSDS